jgi:hypothetical protein
MHLRLGLLRAGDVPRSVTVKSPEGALVGPRYALLNRAVERFGHAEKPA